MVLLLGLNLGVILSGFLLVSLYMPFSVDGQNNTCATPEPTNPSCADYKFPSEYVNNGVESLCGMMSMPGCTLHTMCEKSEYSSSKYCDPFSIYKTLCTDMAMGHFCDNYTALCTPGSLIKQCNTPVLPLPTTTETKGYIKQMCSMGMPACGMCSDPNNCDKDILQVYSDLCLSMPSMNQCQPWDKYCESISDWPLCSAAVAAKPSMRMYFHGGIAEYVLLETWVPTTKLSYAGTWVAVFAFCVLYEILKMVRTRLEKQWSNSVTVTEEDDGLINGINKISGSIPLRLGVDIPRALLHALEVAYSLLIMLIAMTYNVGLFLAIIAGAFFGMFLVGRFIHYNPLEKVGCH